MTVDAPRNTVPPSANLHPWSQKSPQLVAGDAVFAAEPDRNAVPLAAALQVIASDEALGLPPEQQTYVWERAAELDLAVVKDFAGAHTMPAEVRRAAAL
ncbi:hypothetical protein ACFY1U_36800 [Streptomyces sp. NPDC001351]|uniref:hypothetical protein n=1 Tax=Streptomyces sp. NPDC001351 TaxID=3364564 RepID=UPI0036A5F54B